MQNANLNNFDPTARQAIKEFETWQMKIFAKNAKKGWRFFQPDAFDKPTPRSSYEAFGTQYKRENKIIRDEQITTRIMIGLIVVFMVVLSIL